MKKALFLDLDWTLIRPKAQSVTVRISALVAADERRKAVSGRINLPKYADEVEYTETPAILGLIDAGYTYRNRFPQDATDWELMPGIISAIARHWAAGDMLIIITNQGGIEAGFHTQAAVEFKLYEVFVALVTELTSGKYRPADFARCEHYLCTSNDPTHAERKPNPGMILKAAMRHEIDLKKSLFVGDLPTDQRAAEAAGVKYVDVKDFIGAA